jgi:hypothetical protein
MNNPRDCFWISSGNYKDGTEKYHLFVMLLPFFGEVKRSIFVSFSKTDNQPKHDKTVVIQSPHPELPFESYAAYYLAIVLSEQKLQLLLDEGKARKTDSISEDILEELKKGLAISKDVRLGILEIYEDYRFSLLE